MKIFIDYGFGFLKAENENGNKVIIPSIAGEMQDKAFSLSGNSNSLGITTNEGSWLFGEDAMQQSTMVGRTQDTSFFLSNEFKAGILLAITELTRASSVNIELMLALPYNAYTRLSKNVVAHLAGSHKPKRVGRDRQNITITFPEKHPTFPQNYAPMFAHFLNEKGQPILPDTNRKIINLAIFNGGSHTIEYSTIRLKIDGLELKGVEAQSGTSEKGMFTLSSIVKQQIMTEHNQNLTDHEAFNVILGGTLEYQNKDINVSNMINPLKEQYTNDLLKLTTTIWAKGKPVERDNLFAFIVSGGQGPILKPVFQSYHNNIMMTKNPQWDVVDGIRKVRKMLGV